MTGYGFFDSLYKKYELEIAKQSIKFVPASKPKSKENFFGNIFFGEGKIIIVNRVCGDLIGLLYKRLNAANAFIIKASRGF